MNIAGSREGPYEMLEPDVGKLASPVLRGRGGGNIALLPGRDGGSNTIQNLALTSRASERVVRECVGVRRNCNLTIC